VELPFGHREAVHVGTQASLEQGVAVDVQVVGRDRVSIALCISTFAPVIYMNKILYFFFKMALSFSRR
jgi:hypothetical protein